MKKENKNALISIPFIVLIGVGIAWAGSQGGKMVFGIPIFALGVGLAFLIQWIAFIPAYIYQTEKFFDLTGSFTYIFTSLIAVLLSSKFDMRSLLLFTLVVVWAARLGSFLFKRIRSAGEDRRFREIKPSFPRFLQTWTLQGLWVTFTLAAALAGITSVKTIRLDLWAWLGLLIWLVGFAIEAVADKQKREFIAEPENKGKFINVGLWSLSRHPNYFGEITLWLGVAVIAFPILYGWQRVALISPVFVAFLLTKVSGVPMLEKRADEKWGGQVDYESYKANTSVLIPLPPGKNKK